MVGVGGGGSPLTTAVCRLGMARIIKTKITKRLGVHQRCSQGGGARLQNRFVKQKVSTTCWFAEGASGGPKSAGEWQVQQKKKTKKQTKKKKKKKNSPSWKKSFRK